MSYSTAQVGGEPNYHTGRGYRAERRIRSTGRGRTNPKHRSGRGIAKCMAVVTGVQQITYTPSESTSRVWQTPKIPHRRGDCGEPAPQAEGGKQTQRQVAMTNIYPTYCADGAQPNTFTCLSSAAAHFDYTFRTPASTVATIASSKAKTMSKACLST